MQDLLFRDYNASEIYSVLGQYKNKKGAFICRYTGCSLDEIHPYMINGKGAYLFEGLYSVLDDCYICDFF